MGGEGRHACAVCDGAQGPGARRQWPEIKPKLRTPVLAGDVEDSVVRVTSKVVAAQRRNRDLEAVCEVGKWDEMGMGWDGMEWGG